MVLTLSLTWTLAQRLWNGKAAVDPGYTASILAPRFSHSSPSMRSLRSEEDISCSWFSAKTKTVQCLITTKPALQARRITQLSTFGLWLCLLSCFAAQARTAEQLRHTLGTLGIQGKANQRIRCSCILYTLLVCTHFTLCWCVHTAHCTDVRIVHTVLKRTYITY